MPGFCWLEPHRSGLAGDDGFGSSYWHLDQDVRWAPHDHDDHELLHVLSGTFMIEAGGMSWIVPPSVGLWIPAGVHHRASATRGTRFYCQYVAVDRCPIEWAEITTVGVTPLVAELIRHLHQPDLPLDRRTRAEQVLFDELAPVEAAGLDLPMPHDERAAMVAQALIAEPANGRSLDEWAFIAGASARTLTRVFVAETGLSFTDWRALARLRASFTLLAGGEPIGRVARSVGFRTASSFTASFRRTTGMTPGEFVGRASGRVRPAS